MSRAFRSQREHACQHFVARHAQPAIAQVRIRRRLPGTHTWGCSHKHSIFSIYSRSKTRSNFVCLSLSLTFLVDLSSSPLTPVKSQTHTRPPNLVNQTSNQHDIQRACCSPRVNQGYPSVSRPRANDATITSCPSIRGHPHQGRSLQGYSAQDQGEH